MNPEVARKSKNEVYRFEQMHISDSSETGSYLKKYSRFKHKPAQEDWISYLRILSSISEEEGYTRKSYRLLAVGDIFLIHEFNDLLGDIIHQHGLTEKPGHIFNLDKIALFNDTSKINIVEEKEEQASRTISVTEERERLL